MLRSSLRLLASPLSFALSTEGPGVSASTQPREDVSPAAGRTVPMKAIKFGGKGGGAVRGNIVNFPPIFLNTKEQSRNS